MAPSLPFTEAEARPGEELVTQFVARLHTRHSGEVAFVTNERLFVVGTMWPGGMLFLSDVSLDECRSIRYRRGWRWYRLISGLVFATLGVLGLMRSATGSGGPLYLVSLLFLIYGLAKLVGVRTHNVHFDCGEERSYHWRSRGHLGRERLSGLLGPLGELARSRGIATENLGSSDRRDRAAFGPSHSDS